MARRDTLRAALLLLLASCLFPLVVSPRAARAQQATPITGTVLAVPAGDSLEIRPNAGGGDGGMTLVRLHGVECPAAPRALKEVCARYTARLTLGREVTVTPRGRGGDGALWGEVAVGGGVGSLNVALVEAGLARWSEDYAPDRDDLRGAQERAAAARIGLWGAADGSNVTLPLPPPSASPLPPSPTPSPLAAPAVPATPPSLPTAPPATARLSDATPPAPGAGGGYRDLLGVFLVAFGVALGAFVLRDVGRGGNGRGEEDRVSPGRRWAARTVVACAVGGAAVLLAVLPRTLASPGPLPPDLPRAAAVGVLVLLAAGLLALGTGHLSAARRYGRPRELDPARFGSESSPAWGCVRGVARSVAGAEAVRSETTPVCGLWLREAAGVYVVTRRARGRTRGRWRQHVTVRSVAAMRIESEAGDGTGVALLRTDGTGTGDVTTVLPYVVARYYNAMPVRHFFRAPYEGDTRTEVHLLPEGAHVTAWGVLLPPAVPDGLPELVPDPQTGPRVLADDAVAAVVGRRHVAPALASLLASALLAAAACWLAGGGGDAARAAVLSSLGVALLGALVAGLRRAARLTRPGPDALRSYRHREAGLPGRLLFEAVG